MSTLNELRRAHSEQSLQEAWRYMKAGRRVTLPTVVYWGMRREAELETAVERRLKRMEQDKCRRRLFGHD